MKELHLASSMNLKQSLKKRNGIKWSCHAHFITMNFVKKQSTLAKNIKFKYSINYITNDTISIGVLFSRFSIYFNFRI